MHNDMNVHLIWIMNMNMLGGIPWFGAWLSRHVYPNLFYDVSTFGN